MGAAALAPRPLVIDDSLSLINRTGAHYIARDIIGAFGPGALVRRWRRFGARLPAPLPRKLLGRLMLKEMEWLGDRRFGAWPEPPRARRLFLDPLYVLRARLQADDIVLCHDIGPVTLGEIYDAGTVALYRQAYAKIAAAGPGMVFVSQASQQAFVAVFGERFRFLHCIPLYVRQASAEGADEPLATVTAPYLLSVGAFERRKNHLRTIAAYARTGLAAQGVSLVICGARGDAADEIEARAAATPGVVLPGYVSDAQLRWLYRHAAAFVLPSLLEGFGMPALEAALYGLVPIISRDSALTEAVGGLGLPVDAGDVDDIAAAMQRVIALDPAERQAWGERLVAHARGATHERFIAAWTALLVAEGLR